MVCRISVAVKPGAMAPVRMPKRYNLLVPELRKINKEKPEKSKHTVLLFENGALYVFKKDGKFVVPLAADVLGVFEARHDRPTPGLSAGGEEHRGQAVHVCGDGWRAHARPVSAAHPHAAQAIG
mgnify:CR=1 FL=1